MTQETIARWAALPRLAAVVLVTVPVWFDRFSALIAGRLPLTIARLATREMIGWSLGTAAAAWWTIPYLVAADRRRRPHPASRVFLS
ncbi:hypothetical protein Aple_084850 [Acrocarpospora pleiomorpha]|uniref:Uncharacterized protein n=1 Tax=Acrocarpospora pleiomorpha TaxID=90975 RepID=A0A5M3XXC4_9ACTN|nr:hypothetical protein [Acrocarpospora pleiomorpha]GES25586.1 hypothetical protein Aple_084850 [Acrocarpospora pleiomorpha]